MKYLCCIGVLTLSLTAMSCGPTSPDPGPEGKCAMFYPCGDAGVCDPEGTCHEMDNGESNMR